MRSWVVRSCIFVSIAAVLAGCGSSSSKPSTTVAQVRLTPDTISLVAGDVVQITASAVNSAGGAVTTTFTFNSSNNSLATVSPGGLVCGGVWDSSFITCKGTDSAGHPLAGSATITASAGGVSSVPVQVSVHPSVTSITVDPVGGCFSIKQTHQFMAHAFHNATDITNLVGNFNWSPTQASVASIDANGVATILAPGQTGIIASIGSTTSPATSFFRGCLPVQIRLHVNLSTDTSVTLAATNTAVIQADMVDENNVTTASAPVNIISNNSLVASLSGSTTGTTVTLTGNTPGGAGLLAVCTPPTCGVGLNLPIYSNLFQVTVSSFSPATFVYATSSFAPPSGTTPTMIPIDTNKGTAGTAINLPGVPNSLVFAPSGTKAYMGTSAGLASLDAAANTVTLLDPFVGKVLAISADGNTVIESNAANDPGTGLPIEPDPSRQRLVIINVSSNSSTTLVLSGAVAGSFTGDGFKAFIAANNGNVYVFSTQLSTQTVNIGGASTDVATLTSGPFVFVANPAGLEVLGTCNNVPQPAAPITSTPQLVQSIGNADIVVAVNSTGLDIETVTTSSLTPPVAITAGNCTPNVSYSNQFIDFGVGAFTARQLLVPTNGLGGTNGSHIVVLPAGIPKLMVAVPGNAGADLVNLSSGATEALSGGLTLDGNTAWVGVNGTNTVDRVDLTTNSDNLQIATSFKKSDGSAAPPNIVAVQPK